MENNLSNINLRKIAFFSIVGIIALALFMFLFRYLTTGKIIITSNSHATITLTSVQSGSDEAPAGKPKTYTAKRNLKVNVKTGTYIASVQGNSIGTTQLIKLGAHQTLRYTLNPVDTTGVEPVVYASPQNVKANSNIMLYVDNQVQQLREVDNQNRVSTIDPRVHFKSAQWTSVNFGVGQDDGERLYVIRNANVTPLKVPSAYTGASVKYSVAPNGKIYVSFGPDVYVGNSSGNFTRIYRATTSSLGLTGGNNQVIVSQYAATGESKQSVVAVTDKGKVTNESFEIGNSAWSPNSRYIAISNEGGGLVYDTSENKPIRLPSIAPTSFINGLAWLNDSTLFYSTGNQIWVYNLASQQSKLVANMPLSDSAVELSVSDDRSYLYIVDGNGSGNIAVRRMGLHGQKVPDFMYKLQDIMPDRLNTYSMSLVNFAQPPSQPIILVQPYPDSPADNYIQTATTELQHDGFDTNLMSFRLSSAAPGQ